MPDFAFVIQNNIIHNCKYLFTARMMYAIKIGVMNFVYEKKHDRSRKTLVSLVKTLTDKILNKNKNFLQQKNYACLGRYFLWIGRLM